MKVLLISGIYRPEIGGPATYVPELAQQLKSQENIVEIVTLKNLNVEPLKEPWSIKYINRNQRLIVRFIKTCLIILRRAIPSDSIFANGLFQETALALILVKKTSVAKIVGDPVWERAFNKGETKLTIVEFNERKLRFKHFVQRKFLCWSLNQFQIITCPSLELQKFVKFWGVKTPTYFIPNGIKVIAPRNESNEYDLISVSRLVKWKNLDKLIVANAQANSKLAIIGSGPEEENLKKLAAESKSRVTFLGQLNTEQVLEQLFKSKIFILVSEYEGLSFSLLQAMACGLPSIVSNIQGNTDVIKHNEEGLVININESKSLVNSINLLLNSHEKLSTFGRAAHKKVRNKYDQEKQISQVINLLTKKRIP